jgi:hypothetical protein
MFASTGTSCHLTFSDQSLLDEVLHVATPVGVDIMLAFQRWWRQIGALLSSLRSKVLLAIKNILAHAWSVDMTQTILGMSCIISEASPCSLNHADMSCFLVEAWAAHLDFIPMEVGCIMPEPDLPFSEWVPPLFLWSSVIINSNKDILNFCAIITLLEYNDFSPPLDSDDDSDSSSGTSSANGFLG